MGDLETWARALYWLGCGLSFLSYAVRDMLALRILTIANCLLIIPYYIFVGEVSTEPIAMAGVIVVINLFNSYALIRDKRPPKLSDFEAKLHREVFSQMGARQMLKVLATSSRRQAGEGELLIQEGQANREIFLLLDGEAVVMVSGKEAARIGGRRFVGEMTYITGRELATASVELSKPSDYLSFSFEELDRLKSTEPEVYAQFYSFLSIELAEKVGDATRSKELFDSLPDEVA